jgi:hypothetical protein
MLMMWQPEQFAQPMNTIDMTNTMMMTIVLRRRTTKIPTIPTRNPYDQFRLDTAIAVCQSYANHQRSLITTTANVFAPRRNVCQVTSLIPKLANVNVLKELI